MSQELKESTLKTLEQFRKEQEQLEKLAFDALNLSDMIQNLVKNTQDYLESEDKEKAILNAKNCLVDMLEKTSELSETIHESEAAFAEQIENLEAIQMAIDFLCCEWDT